MNKQNIHYITLFYRYFPSFFGCLLAGRNSLYHHHQVLPAGLKRVTVSIKNRQPETACFELHMIDYQSTAFHVQDFHAGTGAVYKNENITVLDIPSHLVGHHPAEGIKTSAHICWMSIQVILHRGGKAEHTKDGLKPSETAASLNPVNRSALYRPRLEAKSRRKSLWQQHPERNQYPVCLAWELELAELVCYDQTTGGQNHV